VVEIEMYSPSCKATMQRTFSSAALSPSLLTLGVKFLKA